MSKYDVGDKFIIEIAEEVRDNLYRIRGFNSLVFDDNGLKKLKRVKDQQKTIKDDFLEKYPNAPLQLGMKVPWLCPKKLGYKIDCPNYMTCDYRGYAYDYCWNMPL